MITNKKINHLQLPSGEKSIAVLPFVNMSPDASNEYFSDGITEEIINALTKIQGLKVIARTSTFAFKGKNEDVRTIGYQLGVTSVLEGSVRKSKNKVRITAQLINTEDGTNFWSKNFDRELKDIFELQDEISLLIADQIRENFGHFDIQEHLYESQTKSIDAYKTYLKGRYFQLKWNIESFKQAIHHYKTAIKIEPTYPLPYCGMVMCYTYLYMWNAVSKDEAVLQTTILLEKVKHLKADLPEYHLGVSSCAIILNWDFALAHSELQKTLSLSPMHTDALEALAGLYIVTGSFNKALFEIEKALEINPLSANHNFMKGNIYYFAGEYENAIEFMDRALKIDPNILLSIQVKLASLLLLNRKNEFFELAVKNKKHSFSNYFQNLWNLFYDETNRTFSLQDDYKNEFQPWELYFSIYSENYDNAFKKLKWGLDNQVGQYFSFRHDPFLKPIRKDKRFQTLLADYKNLSFEVLDTPKGEVDRDSSKLHSSEMNAYLEALKNLMENEKPYLDSTLTLKSLSDKLQLHPNKLSWLINESKKKNFNEFINQFRIEYFKEIALNPKFKHMTLLGMAYESGFNSKTVFNAFFKKKEGITPGAWLKAAKK